MVIRSCFGSLPASVRRIPVELELIETPGGLESAFCLKGLFVMALEDAISSSHKNSRPRRTFRKAFAASQWPCWSEASRENREWNARILGLTGRLLSVKGVPSKQKAAPDVRILVVGHRATPIADRDEQWQGVPYDRVRMTRSIETGPNRIGGQGRDQVQRHETSRIWGNIPQQYPVFTMPNDQRKSVRRDSRRELVAKDTYPEGPTARRRDHKGEGSFGASAAEWGRLTTFSRRHPHAGG